jgi:hypothetical protein
MQRSRLRVNTGGYRTATEMAGSPQITDIPLVKLPMLPTAEAHPSCDDGACVERDGSRLQQALMSKPQTNLP